MSPPGAADDPLAALARLTDLEELRSLKARYFRLLDTKAWEELVEVFTPDAEVDMRAEGGTRTGAAVAFVDGLVAMVGDAVTVHHGHSPELELTGPDTATGTWAMEDRIRWPDGTTLHGAGHYRETYRRTASGWRIASMRLERLDRRTSPPA